MFTARGNTGNTSVSTNPVISNDDRLRSIYSANPDRLKLTYFQTVTFLTAYFKRTHTFQTIGPFQTVNIQTTSNEQLLQTEPSHDWISQTVASHWTKLHLSSYDHYIFTCML
ncbi:hypothetical protein Hdeb2414_s0011g00367161 [Helianthus debilis subsp. tardiflorus]